MDNKKKLAICFIIDHPLDLPLFAGLVNCLHERQTRCKFIAIITDHSYWQKSNKLKSLLDIFDIHYNVARPDYTKHFIDNFIKLFKLNKLLKNINNTYKTYYVVANDAELISAAVCSKANKRFLKILQDSRVSSEILYANYKIDIKLSLIRIFYETIFLFRHSVAYKLRNAENVHHFSVYNNSKQVLYLKNLNESIAENEINFPYRFDKLENFQIHPKKVYFFGSRFLGWNFVKREVAVDKINKILRKIEFEYGADYLLIYKPHPLETLESNYLSLGRFIINNSTLTAEIEFVKYYNQIHAVYSIGSTASKSAFNFSIPTFLTYRMFNFDDVVLEKFNNLFKGMPDQCFLLSVDSIASNIQDAIEKRKYNINSFIEKINEKDCYI
jgi:hypothetical protein